ncbi:hypothetical protein BZL30_2623 [Mycobacterium kansasii]|uniref:Uncharacterized protein n=1 Tax=Mycobacterium kansasii TaxID=1768 RepID=A0A1V3XFZ0_MYCKA|nr:hypothetical protein BZL30_2623 [Mycobacterium kansasii]
MTVEPQPAPKPAKPRLLQDGRDMFWSLVPLVIGCILLAGMVGMCSLQPGGTNRGRIPSYDAARALRADAATLGSRSGCRYCQRDGNPTPVGAAVLRTGGPIRPPVSGSTRPPRPWDTSARRGCT